MKRVMYTGLLLLLIGWIGFMVSFWMPTDWARQALMATALSLGIPGLVAAGGVFVFADELREYDPFKHQTQVKLRCSDCGSKILNPAGTTIGDQLEEEVFMLDDPKRRR